MAIAHRALWLSILLVAACARPALAAGEEQVGPKIADCSIGFDEFYKVGYWTPLGVKVVADEIDIAHQKLRVEVTVQDSDAVRVTFSQEVKSSDYAEGIWPTWMYVHIGRLTSPIEITLVDSEGEIVDQRELPFLRGSDDVRSCTALPATSELVVQLGATPIGLVEALAERDAAEGAYNRHVARVFDVEALPTEWYGYDGVDLVVLTSGDPAFCRRLVADERRFAALRRWVELGGRLVIGCGKNAPELLAAESPLAELAPGTFAELLRLPQVRTLESFAGSPIAIGQGLAALTIPVPRLTDVRGRVEFFGQGEELPLVVRAAQGFGQVTFIGVDVDTPPLAQWAGRPDFLRAALKPLLGPAEVGRASQTLVSTGYDDLAGALRQRLGRSFAGVTFIAFPLVAAAIVAYLLLVGPLDYLFIQKLIGRTWVAWMTFPLIVLLTSGLAIWWFSVAKEPGGVRLNSLELVDVDLSTGLTRGISWATIYSPDARRFQLSIEPRLPDGHSPSHAKSQLSSWGLPGTGLGGMHATGAGLDITQTGYRTSENLEALEGVPILTASAKSLLARWEHEEADSNEGESLIPAIFSIDDGGLLVGSFTNRTGVALEDACLLHGGWGYALGTIRPGASIAVGPEQRTVNQTKTILQRRIQRAAATPGVETGRDMFFVDRASLGELVNVMMFYKAAGGYDFVRLPNRYQSFCDLSPLLELDRAILVANAPGPGSRWLDEPANQAAASGEQQDSPAVAYRFVFPVDQGPQATDN